MWWRRIKTPHDLVKQPLQALFRTLGAGLLGIVQRLRPPAVCPKEIRDILVVRRNRLGDAVLTAQCLRALLDDHPGLRITVVTNAYSREIYEYLLPEAEVLVLPEKHLGTPLGNFWHPEVLQRRHRRFEVSLIASGSFSSRSILLLLFFRSCFRVGVRDDGRPSLFEAALDASIPMSALSSDSHQGVKVSRIFALAGLRAVPRPLSPLSGQSPVHNVLIFTDCNRAQSLIPMALWVAFADALQARGARVSVCGQRPATDFSGAVQRVFCANTGEMLRAIQKCDHVVCSEGGASHVGALLRRKLTVFSGVSIKQTWFPLSLDCTLLERKNLPATLSLEDMLQSFDRRHPEAVSEKECFPGGFLHCR